METCAFCRNSYEKKVVKGSGGKNRVYCYDCLPFGLDKRDRVRIGTKLMSLRVSRFKLETGCQICGYNTCARALEFHHMDAEGKEGNIANIAKTSWASFEKEAQKCIVLCSNCHREEQAGFLTKEELTKVYLG